ncbi:MAG: hypothetical protein JWQ57_2058 [Mucilaginibacter sp.]|nr:hypothetical protein [Mucilaginibacter sp.]
MELLSDTFSKKAAIYNNILLQTAHKIKTAKPTSETSAINENSQ